MRSGQLFRAHNAASAAPLGTIEFALDFRKNGFYRRDDVGIIPYEPPGRLPGGFLFASGEKNFRFVQPMHRVVVF